MIDRFAFVQALDALRCYEEGVLESIIDANVGSILASVSHVDRRGNPVPEPEWH